MEKFFGENPPKGGKFFPPPPQKKTIRIMAVAQPRPSSKSLFKQFEILPVPYQHYFT